MMHEYSGYLAGKKGSLRARAPGAQPYQERLPVTPPIAKGEK